MSVLQRQTLLYGLARYDSGVSAISDGTVCTCHFRRNLEATRATGHLSPRDSGLDLNELHGFPPVLSHSQSSGDLLSPQREKKKKQERREQMKLKKLIILMVVFVGYVCIGALVFNHLEAGPEKVRKEDMEKYVEDFLVRYPCVNRTDVYDLMRQSVVDSEIVYYVVENKTHLDRWDFSGSFGFVISVVTTIGFGNLAPFTLAGKTVCVAYAMVGIPLTIIMLGAIGEKMARMVRHARKCQNPMCQHTPRVNKGLNAMAMVILGMIIVFIVPSFMFSYVEKWHYLESLYFCFTTLSTIGFGDYVIGIHETRFTDMYMHEMYEVIAYIWILLGLAYLSLVYRFLTDTVLAKAQTVERSTLRRLGTGLNRDTDSDSPLPRTQHPSSPYPRVPSSPSPRERHSSETEFTDLGTIDVIDLD